MGNNLISDNKYLNNDNEAYNNFGKESNVKPDFDEVSLRLTAEIGKNFFRYLKSHNLSKDPDLLILPHNNHYYFDENELKNVRTLVNLKNFNLIKNPDKFLSALINVLPPDVNFIGYFSYSKITLTGEGILSGLSSRLNNILDSRTDNNMDQKELSKLLKKYGFKVIDMKEMNGVTYFYSQNIRKPFRITS
jgi:hypothetical protein